MIFKEGFCILILKFLIIERDIGVDSSVKNSK